MHKTTRYIMLGLTAASAALAQTATFSTIAPLPSGRLARISAADDGSVWGIDDRGSAHQWTGTAWKAYPMNAGRTTTLVRLIDISVASSSQVWAVDTSNTPLRLTNAGWAPFRGGGVGLLEKISAGADGTVMGVDSAGLPWQLTPGTSEWRVLAGQVTQISTGGASRIAAVNSAGSVFTLSFDTWRQMTGALSKVSITSRGKIYGVNSVGEFWAYDGSSWRNLGHPLKEVSATENAVWGIDSRGTIELSGTPPTPPTPNPPLMAGLFESPAQATFSNIAPLPTPEVCVSEVILPEPS